METPKENLDQDDDLSNSRRQNENSPPTPTTNNLGFDSAIKVLEVTAQQVVDRISNHNPDLELQKRGSTTSTPKRGSSVGKARTVSESSISSTRSGGTASLTAQDSISSNDGTGGDGRVSFSENNDAGPSPSTPTQVSPDTPPVKKGGSSPMSLVQSRRAQKLLALLQHWIKEANEEKGGNAKGPGGLGDNLYYVSSIESFIRDLPSSSQDTLAHKFSSNLITWIRQLFHFRSATGEGELEFNSVLAHWDKDEGIVVLTKWYLHLQFPNLVYSGYDTFQQEGRFPLIYCSDEDVGIQVTSSLCLSKECFSLIETMESNWVAGLEELILFDKKRNMIPIIFLVNIGKTSKDLEKACRLCHIHKIPVHIYGRNTFPYFVKRAENDQIGSSFTIDLKTWIPSPPLPYLTIYKKPPKADEKLLQVSGLSSPSKNLMVLSPWFCTEVFGPTNTKSVVEEVCEVGQFLLTILKRYDFISIIPNWTTLSDGQVIVSSLICRFKPTLLKMKPGEGLGQEPSPQYVNVLNSWLYHILDRDLKSHLHVEFVDVGGSWHILFDVFKTHKLSSSNEEFIEKMFEHHMGVLESTVGKKAEFGKLVFEAAELEDVDYDSSWAGLGAVRYIPKFYRDESNIGGGGEEAKKIPPPIPANEDAALHRKSNINHLNAQIVDKLKSIDNAFSLGVYGDGDWCVQFGMVTDETAVIELLRLVITTGEDIEESSEFFHQMSELVKKGIEKATEELKRESEDALWEEGILRRVPVVGTFVNWFSPPSRESGIRGRALNLVQGKVESTENIYKYHMQVETEPSATPVLSRLSISK